MSEVNRKISREERLRQQVIDEGFQFGLTIPEDEIQRRVALRVDLETSWMGKAASLGSNIKRGLSVRTKLKERRN